MNWEYTQPVNIKYGNGLVSKLKDIISEMGYTNGMLISGNHLVKSGLAEQIVSDSDGLLKCIFSNISANPEVSEVDECAELIRKENYGFIVALGGGSVLDLAKAAGSICMTSDSISLYHGTGKSLPERHLPLIAIPTTAGTGSEVTCVAVLSDKQSGKKAPIVSGGFYPYMAVIDPELTYTMSSYITACTGIDVLCHAIEGYWSKGHQPICDTLAIKAAKLVFLYLERVCADGMDKEAREGMAEASVMAGLAFTLPKTTSSHACSFPLTNLYHIPHGEACALTLDYFVRINGHSDKRTAVLANELGFENPDAMAERILELKKTVNLRTDIKDLNVSKSGIDELVRISHHPNLYNNPVTITDDILYDLYGKLC